MARPTQQAFNCEPLRELCRQLLFAPANRRMKQVKRAEELHDQIDPKRNYPFDFVNYRITGYHHQLPEETMLVGEAALPDLRLLIDRLSGSLTIEATADQPAESTQELAERLNVSTKTVGRWRKRLGE